ncbi:FkbM family methyltransferase [Sphingomonas pituitosa]|uniref:FkbM family methyltransferase n=1 Tax=Sphingomonas pituitosa TaxID=99597 RepID=UPI000A0639D1|nr:FkbM family methyltransferase [Sphingomonas pituitosa]
MPLTYAQNFEDVILWRALCSIEHGFYIDVGAQDPTFDSVSRHFHQHGWRGAHVEPNPEYAAMLRAARPGDRVIQAAVAAEPGLSTFYSFSGTGLSTAVERVAHRHVDNGFSLEELTVACITLDMVFAECGEPEVHWLKLDVEGFERPALEGWTSQVRPWIVVVEAVEIGGRTPNHDVYEPVLLAKGYHFVYFDGLNRYYVSDAHPELDTHFAYGPSLWDDIQSPRESRMSRVLIEEIAQDRAALQRSLDDRDAELAALREQIGAIGSQLAVAEVEAEAAKRAADEVVSLREQLVRASTTLDLVSEQARVGAGAVESLELLRRRHQRLRRAYAKRHNEALRAAGQVDTLLDLQRRLLADRDEACVALALLEHRAEQERAGAAATEKRVEEHARASEELRRRNETQRHEHAKEVGRLHQAASDANAQAQALAGELETIAAGPSRWARAQAQQALARAPVSGLASGGSSVEVARSIEDLFQAGDRQFVDACFKTLLGRPADPAGLGFYLQRLREGRSRARIVRDIAGSPEALAHAAQLPGLHAFLRSRRGRGGRFSSLLGRALSGRSRRALPAGRSAESGAAWLRELLDLPDEAFIRGAFDGVLRREPRLEEVDRFVAALAGGEDRLTLLARLRWSPEGRRTPAAAAVRQATGWYATRNWPWIGPLRERRALEHWRGGLHALRHAAEGKLSLLEDRVAALGGRRAPGRYIVWAGGGAPPEGRSIWYAGAADVALAARMAGSGARLEAIACTDEGTARRFTDAGIECPVQSVGILDGVTRDAALGRLQDFIGRLERTRDQRAALSSRPLRVAILSTWNEKCGIATHASELASAMGPDRPSVLAPKHAPALGPDGDNVHRLWTKGKDGNGFEQVRAYIAEQRPELLIVQYNFGFYNHPELNGLLQFAAASGVATFVILHATKEPSPEPGFQLVELAPGLSAAARVIVHNANDVDRLRTIGVQGNVLLLPPGVRRGQPQARRMPPGARPILATFGFCLPNKGLVEIVEAVACLRKAGVQARLRMFNALHPHPDSSIALAAVHAAIARHGLDHDVEVFSDFMDLDVVDREIAAADLFVNPYQETGESSSGAVRIGLRNKVPTLVTPLPIFDDLGDAVLRAPGVQATDLAAGIRAALAEAADPAAARAREKRLEDWLMEHDFDRQGQHMIRIARTINFQILLENGRAN